MRGIQSHLNEVYYIKVVGGWWLVIGDWWLVIGGWFCAVKTFFLQ